MASCKGKKSEQFKCKPKQKNQYSAYSLIDISITLDCVLLYVKYTADLWTDKIYILAEAGVAQAAGKLFGFFFLCI